LLGVALVVYLSEGWAARLQLGAYRNLVLVAIIPAFLAVVVLFWVRELPPKQPREAATADPPAKLAPRFRLYLVAAGLFSLANSSDAFLLLRTQNLGLGMVWIALLLAGFNLTYSLVAYFSGGHSDKVGRPAVLRVGWLVYALTYLGFGLAKSAWQVWPLFALYAFYYGLAEGTARALVADLVPDENRGMAYGIYNTVVGITALPASLLAGLVWQGMAGWGGWGASAPFYLGGALAAAALVVFEVSVRGFHHPGAAPSSNVS
jgi:MFS family permease